MPTAQAVFGTWGAPPDAVAQVVLVLGLALGVAASHPRSRTALARVVFESSAKRFAWITAMGAALLSLGYVAHVLRGGPRIVDATSYLLEARAIAKGHFTFPAGFPSASTRGRFLLYDGDGGTLAGLFPPGYPLVLALGVSVGAPLVVGPVLAAGLALATSSLGARVARDLGANAASAERMGRAAALFSIACAVLRYHTADTMAHGLSALYVTLALDAALAFREELSRGRDRASLLRALVVGLALGGLVATRPVSAIAPAVACMFAMHLGKPSLSRPLVWRALAASAIGAIPGVALLMAWQHAVTGHTLGSPQLVYYATSDGPPGCFRYGFGAGIGCLFEHGDFVRHNLPHGYGALAALGTTARRLKMHLSDAANLELFAPLVLAGAVLGRRSLAVRTLGWAVGLQILAYVPFYFDGNYPGGGARFFADVLPVEHVLIIVALAELRGAHASNADLSDSPRFERRLFGALSLSLVGLAIHTSFDHRALAEREGGEPFFMRDELDRANVGMGLVFVDTDHGFSLGHIPFADPAKEPRIVRLRGDDHDWLVFEAYQRPPTYRYRSQPDRVGDARVASWAPPAPTGDKLRFEAEADWPPLSQANGYALPIWAGDASGGRALSLVPTGGGVATAEVAVPNFRAGPWVVQARVRAELGAHGRLRIAGQEVSVVGRGTWEDLPGLKVELPVGETKLLLETTHGALDLDRLLLSSSP